MKMLKDHLLLYDANCPMCDAYSKAFLKIGMLDSKGRAAYQEIPAEACPYVDMQRALNEIALVNVKTGEVSYGIESIFKVLGNSIPLLQPLFKWKPFLFILKRIYFFISFNRRVIIPPLKPDIQNMKPTFRLDYRLAYLVVTWFLSSLILTRYADLLAPVLPKGNAYREFLICVFQIVFQAVIILILNPVKIWEYLGNMMTISSAGSILLLPLILISCFIHIKVLVALVYFLSIAALMLIEHMRRMRILEISGLLSLSWVCYRLIVLAIIFLD